MMTGARRKMLCGIMDEDTGRKGLSCGFHLEVARERDEGFLFGWTTHLRSLISSHDLGHRTKEFTIFQRYQDWEVTVESDCRRPARGSILVRDFLSVPADGTSSAALRLPSRSPQQSWHTAFPI